MCDGREDPLSMDRLTHTIKEATLERKGSQEKMTRFVEEQSRLMDELIRSGNGRKRLGGGFLKETKMHGNSKIARASYCSLSWAVFGKESFI